MDTVIFVIAMFDIILVILHILLALTVIVVFILVIKVSQATRVHLIEMSYNITNKKDKLT